MTSRITIILLKINNPLDNPWNARLFPGVFTYPLF
jgi:hypothetical protein